MELTCDRVCEVLWPLDRPRCHVPEEEAARDHLTRCDRCRAFFVRDAEISRLLSRIADVLEIKPTPDLRVRSGQTPPRQEADGQPGQSLEEEEQEAELEGALQKRPPAHSCGRDP